MDECPVYSRPSTGLHEDIPVSLHDVDTDDAGTRRYPPLQGLGKKTEPASQLEDLPGMEKVEPLKGDISDILPVCRMFSDDLSGHPVGIDVAENINDFIVIITLHEEIIL